MFYRTIGFIVWKLALAEARRRYAGKAKLAAAVGIAGGLAAAAFLATRSSGE
jgi:hypothetical protein